MMRERLTTKSRHAGVPTVYAGRTCPSKACFRHEVGSLVPHPVRHAPTIGRSSKFVSQASCALGIAFAFYEDGQHSGITSLSTRCTMQAKSKPLQALTASDLMNPDVVCLPEEMPLRDAAQLLLQNRIGGAGRGRPGEMRGGVLGH